MHPTHTMFPLKLIELSFTNLAFRVRLINSTNAWNFWEAGKNAFVDLNKEIVQFFSFLPNEIGRFPRLNAHPCFFMPPNKSRHFHY